MLEVSNLAAAVAAQPVEITEAERRERWLAERRTCITGTDVAAILGLSRFASPLTVYLDKRNLRTVEENDAMRWGRRLERTVLEAYTEITGFALEFADSYKLHRVPDFPLLGASLDARRQDGDRRPVDAKVPRSKGPEWGSEWSDAFPIYYQTQGVVQMMATDTPAFDIAALFGAHEFCPYTLHRDLETEAVIKERVERWWKKHIIDDLAPDPDGSDAATEYLKSRFARASEVTKEATPEVLEWVRARREAEAAFKAAETRKKEVENLLRAYLGEAQAIPGVLTYRNNKNSTEINYEAAFLSLISSLEQNRNQPVRVLAQQVLDQSTTIKPGARVLRFAK